MKRKLKSLLTLAIQHKAELLFVGILLLISGFAGGWNMFHYPSYFWDEGTYMARATAVAYHHSLSPYTYWYDHAPGGWIAIALWLKLTGGIHAFGAAVNSGRVLMLIAHLMSTFLLYLIAKHYKLGNFFIAIIILFFSLSPLAITLQRMVLLDNLMVLVMLMSLYLIIRFKNIYIGVLSGFLLGLAVLVKETAIFFIPGMLVLLFQKKPRHHRKFISLVWIAALIATVLTYPIFALLRGEFFPMHSLLGGKSPHVSLITSIIWQSARKGGAFYSKSSQLYFSLVHSWLYTDPFLITLGFLASLAVLIIAFWKRKYLPLAILTFGYMYYLLRGGIINDQYLIPLIPFFALNIGVAFSELYQFARRRKVLKLVAIGLIVGICSSSLLWDGRNADLYVLDATTPQVEAINWLEKNTTKSDLTDIDNYAQADLLYTYGPQMYKNYGYQDFWEVDQDPRLTNNVLHDNWKNINYILVTPRMLSVAQYSTALPLTENALKNSSVVIRYSISYPNSGLSGYLYKESLHRQISIAMTNYVDINKVRH